MNETVNNPHYLDTELLYRLSSRPQTRAIIVKFKAKYKIIINEMTQQLAQSDHTAFRANLHTFKGSSCAIGASSLCRILANIESYDDSLLVLRHELIVSSISSTFKLTCDELDKFIQ